MEHVVYRFRFEEDGAEYYGVTTSRRLAVRWYEHHRGLRASNEVLTYRLQQEKPYLFRVISIYTTKDLAEEAESLHIKNSPKVLNRNSAKSNSIYEKEMEKWKISGKPLRGSPEGPGAVYVVYRYCFIADSAKYYGSTSELRAGYRRYEHRYTDRGNEVLHYRLKQGWPHTLHIISKHRGEESAASAEKACIRNEKGKVLNKRGAGDNSIYEEERRKYKIPKKTKPPKDPNGATCNICERHRAPEHFAESLRRANGMCGWCMDCACLRIRLEVNIPTLRKRMEAARKEGRCIVCDKKSAKINELSCCAECQG